MATTFGRVRAWSVAALMAVCGIVAAVESGTVAADGPDLGAPWVVTLGDSAISGEAGRWAGNTNQSSSKVDALGPSAYDDAGTAEQIAGCHRSRAAEAHIGGGVNSLNLACSGARTYTQAGSGDFKPGIDFYSDANGRKGQALMLQEFASTHNVEAVAVLIGANNFGFADIVQQCVTNWLTSPSWWKNYCYDDSSVSSRFTSSAVAARTIEVRDALVRVSQAMSNAGYAPTTYKIIVQTYASPIPYGSQFRYGETGWTRQSVGGCGVWNRDADWANNVAVVAMNRALTEGARLSGITNHVVLDASRALDGRRLCEKPVGLLEERGISTWQSGGAVDVTEWVSQIRTLTTVVGPYQFQEGLHPSYWGQLALRNCLRLAYNGGAIRGGTCVRAANGLVGGEPRMTLL
jgi:hypothetical protein